MPRTTVQQDLEWRAKYKVGETVQVYNIFDGWQDCTIKKLVWDHMYGRVEYHVVPVLKPNRQTPQLPTPPKMHSPACVF
jgi:hypothetical protein